MTDIDYQLIAAVLHNEFVRDQERRKNPRKHLDGSYLARKRAAKERYLEKRKLQKGFVNVDATQSREVSP